jgi:hypothetical protein
LVSSSFVIVVHRSPESSPLQTPEKSQGVPGHEIDLSTASVFPSLTSSLERREIEKAKPACSTVVRRRWSKFWTMICTHLSISVSVRGELAIM